MKTSSLFFLLSLMCFVLCQCGGGMYVKEHDKPVESIDIREGAYVSGTDRFLYKNLQDKVKLARGLEKTDPNQAIGYYLEVAHDVYLLEDPKMLPLYNHAVGQVSDLFVRGGASQSAVYNGEEKSYRIQVDVSDSHTYASDDLSELIPVDCLERCGLRSEVSQAGVGAAMVAVHNKGGSETNPFISEFGGTFSTSALIDFSEKGKAILRFYDVSLVHQVEFWGELQPLSINLTAAYYEVASRARQETGISKVLGVFRPEKYAKHMGLYMEKKYDPNKIPLILVHGLVSSPITWLEPMNELFADPLIREKFQVYTFYYPTGFPVRMTGGKLKRDLTLLQKYARANGGSETVDKMVIFGHSMGGLLTSMNVRVVDEATWKELSNVPIDEVPAPAQVKKDYKTIFEQPQVDSLKRAVFFSTPHRGSNMANSWYGSFIGLLIDIPSKFVQLDLAGMTRSMTGLGRSLFGQDGPVNSMVTLKAGNPVLDFMVDQPIYDRVPYHSVIGDRGKGDTPNSSDGVVPYWSSHLDGAESELIVPSGHSSHHDPAAIREMRRILHEHLSNNP